MARETAAERWAREQREIEARQAEERRFRETLPAVMFQLKTLAQKAHVRTELDVTEKGFVMVFHFVNTLESIDTFDTEQWEAEYIERMLDEVIEVENARERRRELAAVAAAKLHPLELAALKEFGF